MSSSIQTASGRVNAIKQSGLLDRAGSEQFALLTEHVRVSLNVPVAIVSIVDESRQVFAGHCGLPEPWASRGETPLTHSFCQHVVERAEPLLVTDANMHELVRENHAIADLGVVAYLGVPIALPTGEILGALAAIDTQERVWSDRELSSLKSLARIVEREIALGLSELEHRNAAQVHHDLRTKAVQEATATRSLLQNAPSFMTVLEGPEHIFKIANDSYLGLVGYRELVGLSVRQALPELEGQGFYELLDEVYTTGKPFVGRGLQIDLQRSIDAPRETAYLNFVYQPIFDTNGAVTGIFVEGSDVTDFKHAEFSLREKEIQLTLALDAAGMGVWEATLIDGAFINVKEDVRAAAILGSSVGEEATYDRFASRIYEDDRPLLAESVQRSLAADAGGILDVEYRMLAANGGPERWVHARARGTMIEGGVKFIGTVRDVTDSKEAEARQQLLAGELQHRIKNTFAMVSAIASQTLRGEAISMQSAVFQSRLRSLADAHDLLLGKTQEEGAIADVIIKALGPHHDDVERFDLDGPDFMLSPKQTLSLAMAVHELATNATKYGALSNDVGRVSIRWAQNPASSDQPLASFVWKERNGPQVVEPNRKGFGSRVISRVFAADFKGEMVIQFAPAGLVCKFIPHPIAATEVTAP